MAARPGPRDSNLPGRLPGLAREVLRVFSLSVSAVSPPRGFVAAMCSLARAQQHLWAAARCPQPACVVDLSCPYTGLRYSWVPHGLRSVLIQRIWSHDKMSKIVIFLGRC